MRWREKVVEAVAIMACSVVLVAALAVLEVILDDRRQRQLADADRALQRDVGALCDRSGLGVHVVRIDAPSGPQWEASLRSEGHTMSARGHSPAEAIRRLAEKTSGWTEAER